MKLCNSRLPFPFAALAASVLFFSCQTVSAPDRDEPVLSAEVAEADLESGIDVAAGEIPAAAPDSEAAEPGEPAETVQQARTAPPLDIMGAGSMDADRLSAFLASHNPEIDSERARRLASLYIEESSIEGVNSDVAFVQMCLETGFLKFGGLVTEEMHNYCGLGSIGPEQPGLSFPDERTGVRSHVQHLKGYGSAEALVQDLVDPRYKYVNPKGKAPTVHGLAGTWAADPDYGIKLEGLLDRLFNGPAEVALVSP